jgi:hypothetical protein
MFIILIFIIILIILINYLHMSVCLSVGVLCRHIELKLINQLHMIHTSAATTIQKVHIVSTIL